MRQSYVCKLRVACWTVFFALNSATCENSNSVPVKKLGNCWFIFLPLSLFFQAQVVFFSLSLPLISRKSWQSYLQSHTPSPPSTSPHSSQWRPLLLLPNTFLSDLSLRSTVRLHQPLQTLLFSRSKLFSPLLFLCFVFSFSVHRSPIFFFSRLLPAPLLFLSVHLLVNRTGIDPWVPFSLVRG